jgi:hypothetical protein
MMGSEELKHIASKVSLHVLPQPELLVLISSPSVPFSNYTMLRVLDLETFINVLLIF